MCLEERGLILGAVGAIVFPLSYLVFAPPRQPFRLYVMHPLVWLSIMSGASLFGYVVDNWGSVSSSRLGIHLALLIPGVASYYLISHGISDWQNDD